VTNHMTGTHAAFAELDINVRGTVRFGNGSVVWIEGCSTVIFACKNGKHRAFTSIYYIRKLKANIISVGQLDEAGFAINIGSGAMHMKDADVLHDNIAQPVCLLVWGEDEAW
jgi:hypothetical protein